MPWALMALLAASACGDDLGEQAKREAEETRAIMGEIYSGLRVALPASAYTESFSSPEQRAEVSRALATLADNAALLEKHAATGDAQLRFLARNVARDAREVQRTYEEGRYGRAAFLLRQITENCVVCHTRLPSLQDSEVARAFLADDVLEQLPLEPRATLQVATRRFDDALDSLEELLLSPDEHAATLLGPLTDYLVVSIRVKGDFERPRGLLERFAQRPDLWTRLRMDVEAWIAALPELEERAAAGGDLKAARELLQEGRALVELPGDRAALAHLVTASGMLQAFIDGHHTRDRDLAQAFYLLGVSEARIGRNYWVTPAPFLLEQAIRIAPDQEFAVDAYALLERETFEAYEGSDWEDLPPEDAKRLDELKRLVGRD